MTTVAAAIPTDSKCEKSESHAPSSEPVLSREEKQDRIAALDATALQFLARGRKANAQAGRAFLQLKALLGHGKWMRHFLDKFAKLGINMRTAESYMKLARDEDSKIAENAIFTPATDPQAMQVRRATSRAEVSTSANQVVRHPISTIFRLPLSLSRSEEAAANALLDSPFWPDAQRRIIGLLNKLSARCPPAAKPSSKIQGKG
jgi:hypothetical protein